MTWLSKKCVFVPFDFSDEAVDSLKTAPGFVTDIANLHAIYVLQKFVVSEPGMPLSWLDDDARKRDAQIAFHARFATSPFDKITLEVRFGDPGREIAAFAEQQKADLIVMPSHGRTGLTRFLIGSVAETVVGLAHCPVLILK